MRDERIVQPAETPDRDLEEVLEAYAASDPGPSRETMSEWIGRYPQYADALMSLTANWVLAGEMSETPDDTTDSRSEMAMLRAMSAVRNILHARRPSAAAARDAPSTTPANSAAAGLFAQLTRVNLSPEQLAERAGVWSVSLMAKLDRRLITAETIPRQIINACASVLGSDSTDLLTYFQLPPSILPSMQYHATTTPSVSGQTQSFADAVRDDPELTDDERRQLLALT